MKQSFGLYRRKFGSKIVESFYDYDTCTIGPYKIPVKIAFNPNSSGCNSVSRYKYYEIMQKYESVLAVFNNNNYCFVVISKDCVEFVHFDENSTYHRQQKLPIFPLTEPIVIPDYTHIGYVKTYQECKAIYTWPWQLLANLDTKEIYDFDCKLTGTPMINPPLSLYKELVDTDFNAVYFDMDTNKPVFI